ncbi:TetR/AcrR family transcriptional regulator [Pleurocapsales cyanobacterium LEGE 06147]|nr:TetR/AcrR family transcriptional regulator [Pleurocapsales cyanobacterium LEGE 06147]
MRKNTVIEKSGVTNYRAAQDLHQLELRKGILDDVSDLLMHEGTAALSMRRIAQLVGCSTTVLYTMFGNKQGLIDELYLRGFEMVRQTLEAVPRSGAPQNYIYALCYAYRNFALTHSTYYAIMFLKVMPEYTPSEANRQLGQKSFQLLVDAVQDCVTPDSITEDEAWEIARIIWATVHGHIGLELAGHFDYPGVSSQQMLERALQAIVEQLLSTSNRVK